MSSADEYLTIAETAKLLKVSPKRLRNMMAAGVFKQGEHFYRRPSLGPRFKQSAVTAWLEGGDEPKIMTFPVDRKLTAAR